jgi:FKBP-type peptidyl-prolyl cis-trans isomerase FklB
MKKTINFIAIISLLIGVMTCRVGNKPETKPLPLFPLTDFADSLSYTYGYDFGYGMSYIDIDFVNIALIAGFIDALSETEKLTQAEMGVLKNRLNFMWEEKQNEHRAINRGELESRQRKNIGQLDVMTTKYGLQYRVLNFQMTDFADSLSYVYGYDKGLFMIYNPKDFNNIALIAGFIDALYGVEQLTMDIRYDLHRKWHRLEEEKHIAIRSISRQDGEAFLEKNARQSDVVTTESGLQYRIVKSGTGRRVKDGDDVSVYYVPYSIEGLLYMADPNRIIVSLDMDTRPRFSFNLESACAGLREGLKMMREGDRWELFLPHNLAFCQMNRMEENRVCLKVEVEVIQINDNPDN